MNFIQMNDNELVECAKSGNSMALQVLIERYSDKVLQKARSFKSLIGIENDDLYQEGMMGFVSAVYSFDNSRDVLFSTYASTLSTRKMLSAIRKINSTANLPLQSYISIEEEKDLFSDMPSPEETLLSVERVNEINLFVEENFSKKEKKVFKLSVLGMTYSQIAEILDCTEKSVDNTMQRIRRKLRSFEGV
ncbi:MAG: sigma-70 family RNA polymerase sigma factor [Clostridia bacterium]|nr:sigma-70 family RNA polymerase sigma factor [Clostridia bacterium]